MDGPLHLYDSISYPQTVWARKKDDCDGFAILAAALLQRWEPSSRPVLLTAMLRPMRRSHTVCVFNVPGAGLWFFDNGTLRRAQQDKLDMRTAALIEGVTRVTEAKLLRGLFP